MMSLIRFAAIALGLVLLAVILWAFRTASFWPSFAYVVANPWGIVTLVDLYVGFFLFGGVVAVIEKRPLFALSLVLLACLLGNLVFAAWVAWRLPQALAARSASA